MPFSGSLEPLTLRVRAVFRARRQPARIPATRAPGGRWRAASFWARRSSGTGRRRAVAGFDPAIASLLDSVLPLRPSALLPQQMPVLRLLLRPLRPQRGHGTAWWTASWRSWTGSANGCAPPRCRPCTSAAAPRACCPDAACERLLAGIRAFAPRPAEWTVEANPESLSLAFLETCAQQGADRLSLGRAEHAGPAPASPGTARR